MRENVTRMEAVAIRTMRLEAEERRGHCSSAQNEMEQEESHPPRILFTTRREKRLLCTE